MISGPKPRLEKKPNQMIDLKFNSSPLKSYRAPKGKDRLPGAIHFRRLAVKLRGFFPHQNHTNFLVSLCNFHIFSLSSGLNFGCKGQLPKRSRGLICPEGSSLSKSHGPCPAAPAVELR